MVYWPPFFPIDIVSGETASRQQMKICRELSDLCLNCSASRYITVPVIQPSRGFFRVGVKESLAIMHNAQFGGKKHGVWESCA